MPRHPLPARPSTHPSIRPGRHELGQNFLVHRPTIATVVRLARETTGPILELGAGDGALTVPLASLGRELLAIDVDGARVRRLARRLPAVQVRELDAMRVRLERPVVVGNIPFHLTTPLLRRLLSDGRWRDAILVTQWEVARKRAGVGGGTMLTAQAAPWFAFELCGRVPAHGFRPAPSVDGGILRIVRRPKPLLPPGRRADYERFVRAAFTGRGGDALVRRVAGRGARPRDLSAEQWARLWAAAR